MAKRNLNQNLNQAPVVEEPAPAVAVVEEPYCDMVEDDFYEADSYEFPQTENGQDVTFVKPVGIGAPVPIVAPKQHHVQLQPIVVPLAVVPYMSQDTDALYVNRREQQPARRPSQGRADAASQTANEVGESPAEFTLEEHQKAVKSCKVRARVCSLFTLLFSILVLVPFAVGAYVQLVFPGDHGFSINGVNIMTAGVEEIGVFVSYIMTGHAMDILKDASCIINVVICAVALVQALVALITLVGGKYPRVWNCLASLVVLVGIVGVMVKDILYSGAWSIDTYYMQVVAAGLALIGLLLAVIFSVSLNRLANKVEKMEMEF